MDAPGNQMRRATAILGAQRLYWDPESLPERPQPLATSASSPRSSPRGWGARGRARGRAPGRAAPGQGSDGWLARSLTAGWAAGWLAEIFFTQDQNPAQAATLWDPWAYELLHHLGATTLAACVSRKLTGMEGAPKRSRSRPHSTPTDYA